MASLNFIGCVSLTVRATACGGSWAARCARHCQNRFGVDPGTVRRISRPFAAASVAAGCPLGARNEGVEAESVPFFTYPAAPTNTTKLVR
jgi:hypothetical protein